MGVLRQADVAADDGRLGERDGLRWWPSLLGLAIAVAAGIDVDDGAGMGVIVAVAAFIYVAVAAQGSPRAAWAWFVGGVVVITAAKIFDAEWLPIAVFLVLAAVLAIWGAARGRWREPGGLRVQAAAMVLFGAAALVGYVLDSAAGGLLVAAGLVAHGVWDLVHHRHNRVVVGSYAEFCGVLDVVLAGLIVWAVLT